MSNRTRIHQMTFNVNDVEKELIDKKMKQVGTDNRGFYLRKMAIDGYVIRLEVQGIQEVLSLMQRFGNNVNQIAKRANATGHVYDTDIQDIKEMQTKIWEALSEILRSLASLQ